MTRSSIKPNATAMLQPHPEMSEVPMGTSVRPMSARRSEDSLSKDNDNSPWASVRKFFRLLVPHILLITVFMLYLMIGAVVFEKLENPDNDAIRYQADIAEAKNELFFMVSNASSMGRSSTAPSTRPPPIDVLAENSPDDPKEAEGESRTEPCEQRLGNTAAGVIKEDLDQKFDDIMEMVGRREWKIARMESIQVGRAWTLPSAMLFCMTTITTIGYGDIVPVTAWGRAFCVLYSIVGIPLSLLCLANIGNLLARLTLKMCRMTHHRVFLRNRVNFGSCRGCSVKRRQTSSKRKVMSGDAEIVMEDLDKPPEYSAADEGAINHEVTNKGVGEFTMNHQYMRSVSIATERPSSHPGGVTKQPSADGGGALKPCACECECECEHQKPDVLEEVPLLIVVVILIGYMCGGAYIMASSEGWSYGTGIYFMFITLTTIGFGDILPTNHYAENSFIPCIFLTLFGLAIMSMCIALVQAKVLRAFQFIKLKTGLC